MDNLELKKMRVKTEPKELNCEFENVLDFNIDSEEILNKKEYSSFIQLDEFKRMYKVIFKIDENGEYTIEVPNFTLPVEKETLIRKVKRTDAYKQAIKRLSKNLKNLYDQYTEKYLSFYEKTPRIMLPPEYPEKLKSLKKPLLYSKEDFREDKPNKQEIYEELKQESKKKFKFGFYNFIKKRKEYIENNLEENYKDSIDLWEKKKEKHEYEEKQKYIHYKNQMNIYQNEKYRLEKALEGDFEYIETSIKDILENINLPVRLDFTYAMNNNDVVIELKKPDEKIMPNKKVNILSTGKASVKNKTKKEFRDDYNYFITGLTFFISGHIFNLSPKVENIYFSLYKYNEGEKEYLFSVKYDRITLSKIKTDKLDSIEAIYTFNNSFDMYASGKFKVAEPLITL
ncbi:MAG: hypothetical protein ACQESN_02605 [Thermotogota bacterium]